MANFKVKVEGLDIFLKDLSSKKISKQLAFGIAEFSNKLSSGIRESVVGYYSISGSAVDSLTLGKSRSTRKRGQNVVEGGIAYRYKPKPLHTFPFKESTIRAKSRFLIPRSSGYGIIKKTVTKQVAVAVRRGKFKTVAKGYYQKGGTSKWAVLQGGRVSTFKSGIYKKTTDETWLLEPIERAPVQKLFGPSVTDMVQGRLDFDPKLQTIINSFDQVIAKHITL